MSVETKELVVEKKLPTVMIGFDFDRQSMSSQAEYQSEEDLTDYDRERLEKIGWRYVQLKTERAEFDKGLISYVKKLGDNEIIKTEGNQIDAIEWTYDVAMDELNVFKDAQSNIAHVLSGGKIYTNDGDTVDLVYVSESIVEFAKNNPCMALSQKQIEDRISMIQDILTRKTVYTKYEKVFIVGFFDLGKVGVYDLYGNLVDERDISKKESENTFRNEGCVHLERVEEYGRLARDSRLKGVIELTESIGDYDEHKPTRITREQASGVIEYFAPIGKFYFERGDGYVACDNSTGDAWTEHFDSKGDVVAFLAGWSLEDIEEGLHKESEQEEE